jgi:hypothetical protein
MRKATRMMISTFGAIIGLMGIEHGLGEVLQGPVAPAGILILSWPDSEFFSILSGEPALTILPDMFITGILAILFSTLYLAWAILFIQRKPGGWVLILLAFAMLPFGAGIFPPVLGVLIGIAALSLHSPLEGWRKRISPGIGSALGKLWPWAYGACLFSWLSMFPGVPLLYYYYGIDSEAFIFTLLFCMFAFLFLTFFTGLLHDIQEDPLMDPVRIAV